jgi:hypothetical protein
MKRSFFKWSVAIAIVTAVLLIYIFSTRNYYFKDENQPDRRVLIDSLYLQNNETLYWFYNADMLGGKSVSYISIGKDICDASSTNAVIKGDLIYEVNANKDTIYITTFKGFETLKTHPVYVFENREFVHGQQFKRHSLNKETPFKEVCK